jgi:RNA polymerase sigma-70 factor, ECF subfamily
VGGVSDTSDNSATSLTLLDRARNQDVAAWTRLVRLYSPLIHYWARKAGHSDESAADIVQEVWSSVSRALGRFQRDPGSGTFRGWLWTITRNRIRDVGRQQAGKPEASGGTEARLMLQEVPESEPAEADSGQDHGLLHRALDLIRGDFEDRTWRAFWRMTVDDVPAADVAQELGMAANAVHQARYRVLRRLREEMAGLIEV